MESELPILCGFPLGKFRFLPSLSRRNTLCEFSEMDPPEWKSNTRCSDPPGNCLEQREHPRFRVRALVDFEWIDDGVVRRGQGHTRDISSKGMFIYSNSGPPAKADLRVEVSLGSVAETDTNFQLCTEALVIRVEPSSGTGANHGFAILNKSYKLLKDPTRIEDLKTGLDIEFN